MAPMSSNAQELSPGFLTAHSLSASWLGGSMAVRSRWNAHKLDPTRLKP